MKRLMVMLSAVAVGFGLFAADEGFVAGTGFESDAVGPFAPTSGWTIPDGDANQALTVTEYDGDAPEIQRPDAYQGETNAKFLDVKTSFGSPITCDLPEAQDMGGIYFDSLVKFTACDEDPADSSYAGAKLVVYTKEIEGTGGAVSTKLFIKGGYITSDGLVPTAFDCGNWTKGDDWVRLTVKSIANVAKEGTVPAFVVFVDGEAVSTTVPVVATGAIEFNDVGAYWHDYNSGNSIIPSLIASDDAVYSGESGKVSKVGFDGQGKIDDLSFTTTVPDFCADPSFFTVTWDEKVVVTSYQVNGGTPVLLTDAQKTAMTVAIPYIGAATVTVEAAPAEGCVIKNVTAENGATWDGDVFTIAADATAPTAVIEGANATPVANIVIEGVTDPVVCYSFADAVAALNNAEIVGSGAKATLALVDDVTGVSEIIASHGTVTIDLAGKTITGDAEVAGVVLSLYGNAAITDTSVDKTGKIIAVGSNLAAVGAYANAENDTLTISGGTYDGLVYVDAGDEEQGWPAATLVIAGESKFSADNSTEDEPAAFLYAGNVAGGFQAADALDTDNYWVVSEVAAQEDGSAECPWLIGSVADFQKVVDNAMDGEYFRMTANVDFQGASYSIGKFKGHFDGAGHTISNYTVAKDAGSTAGFSGDEAKWVGFFTHIEDSTIANVTFNTTMSTTETTAGVAIAVGTVNGTCTLTGVTTKGSNTAARPTSGIVGQVFKANSTLNFVSCTNEAAITCVTAYDKASGFFSYAQNATATLNFTDCVNKGAISCTSGKSGKDGSMAGGFVAFGWNCNVTMTDCVNEGAVSGSTLTIGTGNTVLAHGGLMGRAEKTTVLTRCVNSGNIAGSTQAGTDVSQSGMGGLIGQVAGTLTLTDCSSSGTVVYTPLATEVVPVGSLIGRNMGAITATGCTTTQTGMSPLGSGDCASLKFVTIENDVATFGAFADGCTVMMSASLADQKIAQGETLTVYERVAGLITAAPTTDVAGYGVVKNGDVYSLAATTYNITFTSQDGTTAPAATTYTVESTLPLALADATTELTGIEFKGWTNATYTTAIKAIPELPETLGDIALVAQWDAVVAPVDWNNPVNPITTGTKAAEAWPSLKDTDLAQADAAKLAAWAKDPTKGNITFDNAAQIKVDAFLLDCANTDEAVAAEKAAFKVTSLTQDEDGKWVAKVETAGDGEAYKNGYINIVPYTLEGAGDDAAFYQATLTLQPVTKE